MKRFLMVVLAVMTGSFLYDLLPLTLGEFARLLFSQPWFVGGVYATLILFGVALFFMAKRLQKLSDKLWSIDSVVAGLLPKNRRRR